MGQALEMCVHCENKRGCDLCADLHEWIMEHLEMECELKEYKGTGLTPDQIVKMGMAYEDSKRYSGRLELKLKAYEDAKKEGRMVIIPGVSDFAFSLADALMDKLDGKGGDEV